MTYIDPRGKVLAHLDRVVGWQMGQKPAPVTVEWDLSWRCSLGCTDCHFAHTHTRGPWASKFKMLPMAFEQSGDLADVPVVKRALGEMAHAGVKGIVWSGGGEPTTHPAWTDVLVYAHSLGLEQGMYTLGGLLTVETAPILAKVATWVVVSLDCATPDDYSREKGVPPARFWAACEGISLLSASSRLSEACRQTSDKPAKGATVGVSFLLHAGNWRHADKMLALARELGATYTTFRPAIRTSPDKPSVCTDDRNWITQAFGNLPGVGHSFLYDLAKERDVEMDPQRFLDYRDWQSHGYAACEGIQLSTTVTPDGRVWICPQRRGVTGSSLGNLSMESFGEIWARHPVKWTDFDQCRVMCRLHPVNETLAAIHSTRKHEAFV